MKQKLKNKKYLTYSDGGLMLIPLPFKMKKFKETDLKRHRISLNKKEDKENIIKDNEDKNLPKVKSVKEKGKENEKEITNIPPQIKTKTVILRTHKENKGNVIQNINKKYIEIPIISHISEKPSFIFEEITSGKLYPSYYTFTHKAKVENKITKRKFDDIPVVVHESELPIMAVEEINSGMICPTILTLTRVTDTEFKTENNPPLKEYKLKSVDKKINTKINKKYLDIPIISHNSEKPSHVTEEVNSGKFSSSIQKTNNINKNKTKAKAKAKTKKYVEIPIIEHNSEMPSIIFEDIDFGKTNSNIPTSVTSYKGSKTSQSVQATNNFKYKKYIDIPIVVHESEKPSIVFEEINVGKLNSNIQASITNYKDIKINKPLSNKVLFGKNKYKNKKYVEIPVVEHESEKPKVVFEEINVGKLYSSLKKF